MNSIPTISKGERSITADYFVQELEDGSKVVASLSVQHNKDRKCFSATLNRVTVGHTRSFWMFSGVIIARIPVARYSAKALEAAFESAIVALKLAYESENEKVLQIFSVQKEEVDIQGEMRKFGISADSI